MEFFVAFYDFFQANLGGYEVLLVFISGLAVLLGFWKHPKKWLPYMLYWAIFPIYVTLIRRMLGLVGETMHHERLASDVLNVFMLVPYGIGAYMFFKTVIAPKAKRSIFQSSSGWITLSAFTGMLISGFIEITQTISGLGMGEILDLITNTLGAFIGALGTKVWLILWEKWKKTGKNQ